MTDDGRIASNLTTKEQTEGLRKMPISHNPSIKFFPSIEAASDAKISLHFREAETVLFDLDETCQAAGGIMSEYYTRKQREEYNRHRDVACQRLGITKTQYNFLRRIANMLKRADENSCNVPNFDYDAALEESYNLLRGFCDRNKSGKLYCLHEFNTLHVDTKPVNEQRPHDSVYIY